MKHATTSDATSKLRYISLNYTDNFVDSYRRLTDDRRIARTQAIYNLVQSIPTLHTVTFPTYQEDPVMMKQIKALLEQRLLDKKH
jgi:hypothetical protein